MFDNILYEPGILDHVVNFRDAVNEDVTELTVARLGFAIGFVGHEEWYLMMKHVKVGHSGHMLNAFFFRSLFQH